jgi:hypothetical protein
MKKLIFIILLILPMTILAQLDNEQESLNNTLDNLLELIRDGDIKALSDLASFLNDERPFVRKTGSGTNTTNLREASLSILYYYTDFEDLQISDTLSPSYFRKFLDQNRSNIVFSPFLKKFTNVPIGKRNVEYQLRRLNSVKTELISLDSIKAQINNRVKNARFYPIVDLLEQAGKLGTQEAFEFLQQCAKGKHWGKGKNDRETQINSAICYALRHFESIESAKLIVDILKKHEVYSMDECVIALSKITNVDLVVLNRGYDDIPLKYEQLLDSLSTIKDLKKAGYNMMFEYGPTYFKKPVDYYGKMMLESSEIWWVNYHTIQDIFSTNDPAGLKYTGSQLHLKVSIYNDNLGRKEFDIVDIMESKTGISVEVKDGRGNWTSTYSDAVSKINYLNYWHNHYQDYIWNSEKNQFENSSDKLLEPDQLTELFEKLSSENDQMAMDAYIQLTKSDPEEVKAKMQQYQFDGIYGSLNRSLPMFAKKFLVQLVVLVDFCRVNDIQFEPSDQLKQKVDKLVNAESFAKRYKLENEMINSLTLDELIPLEYYTCLHSKANSSVSRILDKWYSTNWNQIVNDPEQMRIYLKKAWLFDHLGIIGIVNKYILKFNNSTPETLEILRTLIETEADADIKTMALKALNHKSNSNGTTVSEKKTGIPLATFLADLSNQSIETISMVRIDTNEQECKLLFDPLEKASAEDANKLTGVIANNIHIDMTPSLIKSLNINTVIDKGYISRHDVSMNQHSISYEILVSDKLVAYLEYLHDHYFPPPKDPEVNVNFVSSSRSSNSRFRNKHKISDQWVKLYKNNADYKSWGRDFYLERVASLESKDTVTMENINGTIESKYYREKDKEKIFASLPRVQPCNHISYLVRPGDSLDIKYLEYFNGCAFDADDMERIVQLFYSVSPPQMVDYIKQQSKEMEPVVAGEMYYNLMWNTRFKDWIREVNIGNAYKNEIIALLTIYRDQFKEGAFNRTYTEKFIGQMQSLDVPLEEVLQHIIADKSEGSSELAKSVLKEAPYEDLGTILDYYPKLPLSEYEKLQFLSDDFGFCLLDDYSDKMISEFKKNYDSMSEKELYMFYLDQSHVPYKKENELDFERIYDMLKFDIVDGFVGGGGGRRTKHVYSIIRLLEIHFDQHLGKHKKFNNLINSMGYSVSDKAFLWMDFLKKEGYVNVPEHDVPSISNIK